MLYAFPGAFAPAGNPLPPGLGRHPRRGGLHARVGHLPRPVRRLRRAAGVARARAEHAAAGPAARVRRARALPFPLLSDEDLTLTAALRLPTFRAAGVDRLKRLTMIVDPERTIRAVQFPVTDPAGSVDEALTRLAELRR